MPDLACLQPRRICLIKPSALGDVVQTLPVLAALRRKWPDAEITWVIASGLAGLLEGHPHLDDVILFDRKSFRGTGLWSAGRRLWRTLRQRRFDLTIDLQGLLRSGLMTLATGSPVRIGLANAREAAWLAYTHRVPVPTLDMPALDRYWLLVRALGIADDPPAAQLGLTDTHRQWVGSICCGLPRPWVVCAPGAQWETKRWPAEKYAAVLGQLALRNKASIVLIGGPGEEALTAEVRGRLPGGVTALDLGGKTPLLSLAAVLEQADVLLSGDTGPMHLAAALGTPCVSLFTCTSPLRAGPRGEQHTVLATDVSCASSYLKRCDSKHCMDSFAVAQVATAVERALGQPQVVPLTSLRKAV